jgi:putative ABC transport system permease protein
MIQDYFALVLNNLKRRGIRSWLTMLGIFIGIAAVVSLITLGAGLQSAITGQFATLSVDTLTITNTGTGFGPPGSAVIEKLNEDDLKIVENTPGVKLAVPRLIRVGSVDFNKARDFRYIGSIPENNEHINFVYTSLGIYAEEGRLLNRDDHGKVVLGNDFKSEEIFGKRVEVGNKLEIQGKNFEVVGILEKASTFTINSVVMMLENDMKDVLDIGDEIDLIVAQVEDKDDIEEVAEEITREFRKDRDLKPGKEDFAVETPLQAVEGVNNILGIVNIIVIGIAAISLLVGGIGITNTMYTSVLERTKEIGIMKAIGAQNKDILTIFLVEAGLLGLIGGIIGALIGLSLAFAASGLAGSSLGGIDLGVKISYPLLISAISFSFFLGIISGILPALQASKLSPVDALRK